jgi:hypothetical protein
MPPPNALRLVLWITLSASLLGAFFAEKRPLGIADFVNTELHGALAGGLNGGILSSFEIFVLRGAKGASLRQLPFLPYLALRSLLYLGIILLVLIASNLPVGISRADVVFSRGQPRLQSPAGRQRSAWPGRILRLCRPALLPPAP